jgi:hypothetical protein
MDKITKIVRDLPMSFLLIIDGSDPHDVRNVGAFA